VQQISAAKFHIHAEIVVVHTSDYLSDKSISSCEIEMICQLYGADANAVAAEMSDFKTSFKLLSQTSTVTSIDGMFQGGCDDPLLGQGPSDNEEEHAEEDVDDESVPDMGDNADFLPAGNHMKLNRAWQWQRYAFMKPLQLLSELSGFPSLYMLYSIFACLAVSSASAERALSKLRIIKNRLRSSMSDDYLSALMIISSEKDLLLQLTDDDKILRFARASPTLGAQLLR